MRSTSVLLDDRLLIEQLLVGLPGLEGEVEIYTTFTWHYRACRAAVLGAGGHLSGPFQQLDVDFQADAIGSLLNLDERIRLPSARSSAPAMANLARQHPRLNFMNLEAVAVAKLATGSVWLSPAAARGILPGVLDEERVSWMEVPLP